MNLYPKEMSLKDGRPILLRPVQLEDAAQLMGFLRGCYEESPYLSLEPEEFSPTLEREEDWIRRNQGPGSLCLVAELEGKIVGNARIYARSQGSKCRHRAGLGITVRRAYWSLGLGRALMTELLSYGRDWGFEQLELEVYGQNQRAQNLYRSLGFVPYGELPRAFRQKDGSYDKEILMVLDLRGERPCSVVENEGRN